LGHINQKISTSYIIDSLMESSLTVNKKMDIANNYNLTKNLKNSLIKKVRGFLGWTLNLNR
jgi:hypothetical protein